MTPETIKILEENTGRNYFLFFKSIEIPTGHRYIFIGVSPKQGKQKKNKILRHQNKNLLYSKRNHHQNKKATYWIENKWLVFKIYKELIWHRKNWIKNGQKTWVGIFLKKYRWSDTWKDAQHHSSEKYKSEIFWAIVSVLSLLSSIHHLIKCCLCDMVTLNLVGTTLVK